MNKTSLDLKTHVGIFQFVGQICMLHHKKIEWKISFWIYKWKKPILSLKFYNIQNHAKGEKKNKGNKKIEWKLHNKFVELHDVLFFQLKSKHLNVDKNNEKDLKYECH